MQSLYCDLGATPCWWSSVLLKLCSKMLQVYDMNNSTITGNGIVHPSNDRDETITYETDELKKSNERIFIQQVKRTELQKYIL